jgi:hypothetical protein
MERMCLHMLQQLQGTGSTVGYSQHHVRKALLQKPRKAREVSAGGKLYCAAAAVAVAAKVA